MIHSFLLPPATQANFSPKLLSCLPSSGRTISKTFLIPPLGTTTIALEYISPLILHCNQQIKRIQSSKAKEYMSVELLTALLFSDGHFMKFFLAPVPVWTRCIKSPFPNQHHLILLPPFFLLNFTILQPFLTFLNYGPLFASYILTFSNNLQIY